MERCIATAGVAKSGFPERTFPPVVHTTIARRRQNIATRRALRFDRVE
jgi:hypothetical protein